VGRRGPIVTDWLIPAAVALGVVAVMLWMARGDDE
jgi:hypothetical protein